MTNSEEPTADIFQQCLFDINFYDFTRADICDYAYPVDNEYFGQYNEGCLNYEEFVREEELIEPVDPENPNESEESPQEEPEDETEEPVDVEEPVEEGC